MGFNLELMFDDLFEILNSDKKAAKKCKEIVQILEKSKQYAKECGQLCQKSF